MRPMNRHTMLLGMALAAIVIGTAGCPGGPALKAFPGAFNFVNGASQDTLALSNTGIGTATWNVAAAPSWLTVAPMQGNVSSGIQSLTLTVDYTALPVGATSGELLITSNGGNLTIPISVTVTTPPTPPVLEALPSAISFGDTTLSLPLSVRNTGGGTLSWSITNALPWLTLGTSSGSTTTEIDTVSLTVSRNGLASGTYSGTITVNSNGGSATVDISMTVGAAAPQLVTSPQTVDVASNINEGSFTIKNGGTGTLTWNAAVAISPSAPWLSVAPASGDTTTETDTLTVTVDRSNPAMQAGTNAGTITVTSNGGTANVTVNASALPAALEVTPLQVDFGNFATSKLVSIGNSGVGTISWSINAANLPSWLSIDPLLGTTGATPDAVLLTANRFPGGTALTPGTYTADIPVTSNAGDATLKVKLSVAVEPVLGVDSGQATADGQPIVPFGDSLNTATMVVSNQGTGTLDWSIDPAKLPSWLVVQPNADSLTAGSGTTVTLGVKRAGLETGSYVYQLPITSNGGTATVEVSMVVPLRAVIATDVDSVDLGLTKDSGVFAVFNSGDPDTILNFKIVSNKKWLFVYPDTGTSRGVAGSIKDLQDINLSVDRSSLDSSGSVGVLTVYATDQAGAIDMDFTPVEVNVSVQSPTLSFETATARVRTPSMVRWVTILRDIQDRAIPFTAAQLAELDHPASGGASAFRILEKATPLEQTETNQFLRPGNNLRTHIVFLLDYSGSMAATAETLNTDLQTLYTQAGTSFFNGIFDVLAPLAEPGAYEVALMEFHERGITPGIRQNFTSNKGALLNALQTTSISDHGATELLPAIQEAADALVAKDGSFVPFDDADVRAVVVVTDGRLTTPPGEIATTVTNLQRQQVRVFTVAWGSGINNEVLTRLSGETGGHFYPVLTDAQNLPAPNALTSRLEYRDPATEPRPLTIPNDLAAQVVLGYTTLKTEASVPTRFGAKFNDPTDNPDQGLIEGETGEQTLDFSFIAGDVTLGQISFRSPGIAADGSATVTLRAEYIPRNIREIRFTITTAADFTLTQVAPELGGLISTWSRQPATNGSGTYTFTAQPSDPALPYGAYGDLVTLRFEGLLPNTLPIDFAVDNSIYGGTDPKRFVAPARFQLNSATSSVGPAFPAIVVTPLILDFGGFTTSLPLDIQNIGGTSVPEGIVLNWSIAAAPSYITVLPEEGTISDAFVSHVASVKMDRTVAPGPYVGTFTVSWDGGSSGVIGSRSVTITALVQNPVLTVSTNLLDFGLAVDSQVLSIRNTGQSTLTWSIETGALPTWLFVTPTSGTTTTERDDISVSVDRTGLATGTYSYPLVVEAGDGTTQTVTVQVQAP